MGFGFQSGGYASVFFGLTFAYEIVLIGLCVFLFGIANRTRLGLYAPRRMSTVTAFAEFWWWFIIVGVLSYLLLYILPFLNIES
jgi:heme/copper-type cytochrome/quinol oxidase subunit 3